MRNFQRPNRTDKSVIPHQVQTANLFLPAQISTVRAVMQIKLFSIPLQLRYFAIIQNFVSCLPFLRFFRAFKTRKKPENRLIFRFSGDGNLKQKAERAFAKFLLNMPSKKELCEGSDILSLTRQTPAFSHCHTPRCRIYGISHLQTAARTGFQCNKFSVTTNYSPLVFLVVRGFLTLMTASSSVALTFTLAPHNGLKTVRSSHSVTCNHHKIAVRTLYGQSLSHCSALLFPPPFMGYLENFIAKVGRSCRKAPYTYGASRLISREGSKHFRETIASALRGCERHPLLVSDRLSIIAHDE